MAENKSTEKDLIIKRLNRIEGQVKGIRRMVEEEKFCGDILIQVSAVRSALNSAAGLIIENYVQNCIGDVKIDDEQEDELDNLIKVILQYTK